MNYMEKQIKLYNGKIFELSDNLNLSIFHEYMRSEYGVSPIQICIEEDGKIWLTSKLGEKYSLVGEVIKW